MILATCLWLAFTLPMEERYYTIVIIVSLLVIQVIALIAYINKTNRELGRFFTSLKDEYSTYQIADTVASRSHRALSQILNETGTLLRKARLEKEKQYQFMQFIFESTPAGMIITDNHHNIKQVNKAAIGLTGLTNLKHLNQLDGLKPGFDTKLTGINPGKQELIRYTLNNELMVVMVSVSNFRMDGNDFRLYVLQDFKNEMEENELHSWQKLIRILNHEIMNSITPIITLTGAIKKGFIHNKNIPDSNAITEELIRDTVINTEIIEERSKGLKEFIEKYRNISRVTNLNLEIIEISQLFSNVLLLFDQEIKELKITVNTDISPADLKLEADLKLIEQVLINLFNNAIDALRGVDDPFIVMKACKDLHKRVLIKVCDNGQGIPPEIMGDIFTPFFTTKEEGAGIGLSFCRQIIKLHKGNISAKSDPHEETMFILKF